MRGHARRMTSVLLYTFYIEKRHARCTTESWWFERRVYETTYVRSNCVSRMDLLLERSGFRWDERDLRINNIRHLQMCFAIFFFYFYFCFFFVFISFCCPYNNKLDFHLLSQIGPITMALKMSFFQSLTNAQLFIENIF